MKRNEPGRREKKKFHCRTPAALRLTALALALLCLTGCWDIRELDSLAIVLGIGVDQAPAPDDYSMTVQIVQSNTNASSSSGQTSGSADRYYNVTNSGTAMAPILRYFTHILSRRIYTAHNEVLIFGEDLARKGVGDCLDYFSRDNETRMTVYVMISRGKAADIFEVPPILEDIPASDIAQLVEDQDANSQTVVATFLDLTAATDDSSRSVVLPMIEKKEINGRQELRLDGSAVLKNEKMIGELDRQETRGYLWIMGQVKSGIINANVKGARVSTEIYRSTGKVTPVLQPDGTFQMKVEIFEEGNMDEQTSSYNVATTKGLTQLEEALKQTIQQEITAALDKAQRMDADIFGFGSAIYRHYPKEWDKIKPYWNEIFKTLKVTVDVRVRVRGVGRIVRPDYPEED